MEESFMKMALEATEFEALKDYKNKNGRYVDEWWYAIDMTDFNGNKQSVIIRFGDEVIADENKDEQAEMDSYLKNGEKVPDDFTYEHTNIEPNDVEIEWLKPCKTDSFELINLVSQLIMLAQKEAA
jgi:hypothetical protein